MQGNWEALNEKLPCEIQSLRREFLAQRDEGGWRPTRKQQSSNTNISHIWNYKLSYSHIEKIKQKSKINLNNTTYLSCYIKNMTCQHITDICY